MIQLETDLTLVKLHAADKQFVEACMLHGADNEVQKHACCMTAHTLLLCQSRITFLLICKCLAYVATSQCRLLQ